MKAKRSRKFTTAAAEKLRAHLQAEHPDWFEFSEEVSDELAESYHRSDHIYAGADKQHKHQSITRGS